MGTLVAFHAHPDDECITTGGSLARAAAEGHRVVLVVATNGEFGESPDDLAEGESLVDRRRVELQRSAAALGVHRVEWLGYKDSGMTGWEQNTDPDSFWQADVDAAADKLAAILIDESADVVTTYDWHGNYGHPDHIQVHRVGHRAADIAGTPVVFEATMNRDHIAWMVAAAREMGQPIGDPSVEGEGAGDDFDPNGPADDGNPFGTGEDELTLAVDVTPYLAAKRESIRSHRSQVTDTGFFLDMAEDVFAATFGIEWYIRKGGQPPLRNGWLFE